MEYPQDMLIISTSGIHTYLENGDPLTPVLVLAAAVMNGEVAANVLC